LKKLEEIRDGYLQHEAQQPQRAQGRRGETTLHLADHADGQTGAPRQLLEREAHVLAQRAHALTQSLIAGTAIQGGRIHYVWLRHLRRDVIASLTLHSSSSPIATIRTQSRPESWS